MNTPAITVLLRLEGFALLLAHIGFDRALGHGLEHAQGFRHTHLGVIGRPD